VQLSSDKNSVRSPVALGNLLQGLATNPNLIPSGAKEVAMGKGASTKAYRLKTILLNEKFTSNVLPAPIKFLTLGWKTNYSKLIKV